jgi:predicted transposase YbfD/YdcC
VLAVKGNQDALYDDVMQYLGECLGKDFAGVKASTYTTTEEGHGRKEERHVIAVPVPEGFRNRELWAGLESLCLVARTREVGGQVEGPEAFYYISSLKAEAEGLGGAIRGHWGIENGSHWILDMSFREDESRVRKDHAPANLGLRRRLALSLLKRAKGLCNAFAKTVPNTFQSTRMRYSLPLAVNPARQVRPQAADCHDGKSCLLAPAAPGERPVAVQAVPKTAAVSLAADWQSRVQAYGA